MVMKRPDVSLARRWLNAGDAPQAGRDATGGAQRASLAKMVLYYSTQLAASAKRVDLLFAIG
jgi:hypothetical protein